MTRTAGRGPGHRDCHRDGHSGPAAAAGSRSRGTQSDSLILSLRRGLDGNLICRRGRCGRRGHRDSRGPGPAAQNPTVTVTVIMMAQLASGNLKPLSLSVTYSSSMIMVAPATVTLNPSHTCTAGQLELTRAAVQARRRLLAGTRLRNIRVTH